MIQYQRMIRTYLRGFINLIYPLSCQVCSRELDPQSQRPLCQSCWEGIQMNLPPYCPHCGKSLPASSQKLTRLCEDCQHTNYHFTRAWAACVYEGTLRECIHLLKYSKKLCLARPLSQLMVDFAASFLDTNGIDYIVPVPLHTVKMREREFNQAYLLSRPIADRFGIPISVNNLQRIRLTPPQVDLARKDRLNSPKGTFKLRKPEQFYKKSVLLIDDVFTTGSTVNECSRLLAEAEAKEVNVLTLARGV